jgi:hypothetical protein
MGKSTRRWVAALAVILASGWLCFVAYVDWAMHQPPEVFGRVMASMPMPAYFLFPFETMWNHARAGHIMPGSPAPDFALRTLDGDQPVQLASLWAKQPVVLVFGSFT